MESRTESRTESRMEYRMEYRMESNGDDWEHGAHMDVRGFLAPKLCSEPDQNKNSGEVTKVVTLIHGNMGSPAAVCLAQKRRSQ